MKFLAFLSTCLQHTFPHDYRSGPSYLDWDPTKWIIAAMHRLGYVKGLRRARDADLRAALAHMQLKGHHHHETSDEEDEEPWNGPVWSVADLKDKASQGACLLVIEGYVVDATAYLGEHVSYLFSHAQFPSHLILTAWWRVYTAQIRVQFKTRRDYRCNMGFRRRSEQPFVAGT